ncbi:zinc finger CCHC domain-containing protein 8 isoform X2 [Mastacembelus armatus]|nr:zinc finger CCHC domain-containing protein 8 isoform X2 [Mastacembelus armatus]
MKPQNSAFTLDEDVLKSSCSSVKTTTEAFKVVGSVLYFTTFSVDKLGQPLINENPQLTDGWDVPTYQQVFNQVIGTDGLEIEMKDKRPKSMCFNCGSSSHQLRDCPKPKDMAAINERRKEFNQNNNQGNQSNQRYHADEVEERFAKYKPGVMSEALVTALGIDHNTLPPLIYRMRQLGYPPGWLKEAELENSGLTLYDGNASNDNVTDNSGSQNISYDVSKLVDFPGFNVPAPHKMKDEFMQYGSIPMQTNHMKQNYADYLSNNFPTPGGTCNKRRHESDSSALPRKKTRPSPDLNSDRSSDMDIESDPGTPYQALPGDFQFQPPLPPGSPCFGSPPPLPQGTPPATPTPPPLPKGTPPPTPTNGSPALRGRNWSVVSETVEGTEDEMTLEELEEQQRLIWAALENADTATNSDCETPAVGTPIPSSPSVSTPVHVDTETEEVEEAIETMAPAETCHSHENTRQPEVQETCSQSPGPIRVGEDSPESPEPVKAQHDSPPGLGSVKSHIDSLQSPEPIKSNDESPQSPNPIKSHDESPESPDPIKSHDDSPQSPDPVKSHDDSLQSPDPVKSHDDSLQSPNPVKSHDDSPQSPDANFFLGGAGDYASPKHVKKIEAVPHRSRFAAGIVPFEDTPEFTEVAEATGTYLRIRDLLKSSPRNLSRKNKS